MVLSAKHLRTASSPWEDLVGDGEGREWVQQRRAGAEAGAAAEAEAFNRNPKSCYAYVQLRM